MCLFKERCVGSHTVWPNSSDSRGEPSHAVGPNPSDSRGEPLSRTKVWFLNPWHCWVPRKTVVSKYRQLTGEASCDAEAVYFYTGGARFESGPGHCTVTEKFVGFLQAFSTTTVTLRPRPLASEFCSLHYPTIILAFDGV
jgi:hypothetical protein